MERNGYEHTMVDKYWPKNTEYNKLILYSQARQLPPQKAFPYGQFASGNNFNTPPGSRN